MAALRGTPHAIGLVHSAYAADQPGLGEAALQNLAASLTASLTGSATFVTATAASAQAALSEGLQVR